MMRAVHRELGRLLLGLALIMAFVGSYIGLLRRGDVRPWYRRLTYAIILWVVIQGVIGAALWFLGGRPGEDVHIIYGFGAALALPFFAFVEVTAQKRPAMGSYIWGFTLLLGILLRSLLTGS